MIAIIILAANAGLALSWMMVSIMAAVTSVPPCVRPSSQHRFLAKVWMWVGLTTAAMMPISAAALAVAHVMEVSR